MGLQKEPLMDKAVTLLPGHGNKPEGWDVGAVSPATWEEAELVRDIVAACWRELQRLRVPCKIASAGSYTQRGQDADAGTGSRLVVQFHADASAKETGPDVARVFYWPPLPGAKAPGEVPAQTIAQALRGVLPWPVEVYAATADWPGPRACLAAVRATSVLVEVGFTDGRQGRELLPGLAERIGKTIAHAI
jgi:N-acetylmuramoyl-L-alanine amidase